MYKHCSTEESTLRQRQFEQCLLELMQQIPYSQITISDLCEQMNLSRKSFYRYFSSKDGCLYALIDHSIMEFSSAYLPENTLLQRDLYEHYFNYWKKLSPLLTVLCQNQLTTCLFERTLLCITEEEHEFRNFLHANNRDDDYESILFVVCGITGILLNWHNTGYRKTPSQMAATLDQLLRQTLPVSV